MAPEASVHTMLKRLYPYDVMLGKEGQNAVLDALSVSITFKWALMRENLSWGFPTK